MAKVLRAVIQTLHRYPPDDGGVSLPLDRASLAFHAAADEVRASLGLPPAG